MKIQDSMPSQNIKDNVSFLKNLLGTSSDIVYRYLTIQAFDHKEAVLIYVDGLSDSKEIDDTLIKPLQGNPGLAKIYESSPQTDLITILLQSGIFTPSVKTSRQWEDICDNLLSGYTILLIEGFDTAIINGLLGWKVRAVSEPQTEVEVRGPRDSFNESVYTNISLIRRRIRDYGLRFESYKIGRRTKTDVFLAYMQDLADKEVLTELRRRLERIDTDSILESGMLEEFIQDSKYSPFPQIQNTERPDKASSAILQGKIVVLIDNTPFVLILPSVFWDYIQAPGDYYDRFFVGSFIRIIRLGALLTSLFLPSIYVLLAWH